MSNYQQVSNYKVVAGLLGACALAACSSGGSAQSVDIKKVFTVESTFGAEFRVKGKGPTGIDPQLEGSQGLPPSVTFEPADCGGYTSGQRLPLGTQGKMAAAPVMNAYASKLELLGRRSGNPALQDFAVLSAQYRRAFVAAIPTYVAADNHLANAANYASTTVLGACTAAAR